MSRQDLLDEVTSTIGTNGAGLITGQVLQNTLALMINSMPVLGEDAGLKEYDTARTYFANEGAIYSGLVWKANEETTGTFDESKWTLLSKLAVVQDIAGRDALSFRFEGLLAYVKDDQTLYQLQGGTTNNDWAAPQQAEVHIFRFAPSTNGQQAFTIPNREIMHFTVNGIEYGPAHYTLTGASGNTQTLNWESINLFGMETDDELAVLYKGSEVTI